MKLLRRIAMILAVLILACALTACGGEDVDKKNGNSRDKKNVKAVDGADDEKDPGNNQEDTLKLPDAGSIDKPEKLVKYTLESQDFLNDWLERTEQELLLFSNPAALKALDLHEEEEDEVTYTWAITGSREYGTDADVTAGIKTYVRKMGGDPNSIQGSALVEVITTVSYNGGNEKVKQHYATVLLNGRWYLVSERARTADSFETAESYWANQS